MPLEMTVLEEIVGSRVEQDAVVSFAEGLVGLPAARRFRFESSPDIGPLLRMRCLDRSDLTFLVLDPTLLVPDYQPAFVAESLASLGLTTEDRALLLVIARISTKVEECTANLQAPLLINPDTLGGRQVILEPGAYSTRHPLVHPA